MPEFEQLLNKLSYLKKQDLIQVKSAYAFALDAHEGQYRKSGEPYITHPLAVASILIELNIDTASICAALLHDVIEDTACTKSILSSEFGTEIANLVDGVSKITQVEYMSEEQEQAENFRKMLLAMSKDIRVIIIKLADRLHNMRTIAGLSRVKQVAKSHETIDIYVPIAKRLGMHEIAVELERLGFKTIFPFRYKVLASALNRIQSKRTYLLEEIKRICFEHIQAAKINIFGIETREKNLYSIYCKMKQKGKSFSDIMDVYAIRICVETLDECYRTLGIIHQLYRPMPNRFKDYIALPKTNHYQSLHTVLFGPESIPIEVQIRTQEMDALAETGVAAHWLYKLGDDAADINKIIGQDWLKQLLEIQKSTGNSLEFLESIKLNMFPNEIFVFTPKGKILELPANATALDFAYAVHTEVGHTCVAAKVDRQLAPLSTQLSSGQTVEIVSSDASSPSPGWLDIVVTPKSKSSIRHYFKVKHQNDSKQLGESLLKRAFSEMGISFQTLSPESFTGLLSNLCLSTLSDLYEDIGLGNRSASIVCRQYLSMTKKSTKSDDEKPKKPLVIHGTEGMIVNFSTCCYPIPGDPIIGILSPNSGLAIHRENCKKPFKFRQLTKGSISVCWSDVITGEFPVQIWLKISNVAGSLAALAVAVGNQQSNIKDIEVDSSDASCSLVSIVLMAYSRSHLSQIMRSLKRLKCVYRISRHRYIAMRSQGAKGAKD